ncbi:hypothetical protein [Sphingomonas aerolata]|uniref:hypothetical protein n=1 Tax=Sphingomonas aerolata TaxID=185951 RepID=UPI00208E1873|nr:hypothetical protein [Sphingomonas aerolata]USR02367.1 hypothetical protein NEF64_18825 [Sphingomonas aerolata]
MKKAQFKIGCLPSVLLMIAGLVIIFIATSLSENGSDYSALVYAGFIVSLVGIALTSFVIWDFLRSKLGLKKNGGR